VDPVPDPVLLRKSSSADPGNYTQRKEPPVPNIYKYDTGLQPGVREDV
jgi:hypothetical protein